MVAKYEGLLVARGSGAFSQVEYDARGAVMLRTAEVKTTDVSGAVRLYFTPQREQVLTGRRYDILSSGLILLRPGSFYRVQTTLEIVDPLPEGVTARVVLHPDVADIMSISSDTQIDSGFSGTVFFIVQPYRKIEAEKMTSFASLLFKEDINVERFFTGEVEEAVPLKTEYSNRAGTQRRSKSTVKKMGSLEG